MAADEGVCEIAQICGAFGQWWYRKQPPAKYLRSEQQVVFRKNANRAV